MNRWTFAVLVILIGWCGRDGVRADEPAQPKQVLIPFNSLEKVAVSGVLNQLDAMRRAKCDIEHIEPANCGRITPDGVYKLIQAPKAAPPLPEKN